MKFSIIIISVVFLAGCQVSINSESMEDWKNEIIAVEKEFNDLAQAEGLATAFETFAANDGAILRRGEIVKGSENIGAWYQNNSRPNTTLTWAPEFVDVSDSGDLAYTYGPYEFTAIDSVGDKTVNTGYFHTVWKRQDDGSWKFVWD